MTDELELIKFVRGTTVQEVLEFNSSITDPDTNVTTVEPIDLTLYDEIVMEVRTTPMYDSELVIRLSLGDGLSIVEGSNNKLSIFIDKDKSSLFKPQYPRITTATTKISDKYYYRDFMFRLGDIVTSDIKGRYQVVSNITELSL
jgi:hypothetical protein